MTPRAFDAIVAQLTCKGYREFQMEHDGVTWNAFFETDEDPTSGMNSRHECCSYTRCVLAGAWGENVDGANFAGNGEEITAMIGEAEVARWEAVAEERVNG